jgi:hypothetical protein
MLLWKLYTIVASCLLFLLFAAMAACSQPSTNIEKPSAGQKPAEFEVGPITFEPPTVMVGDTVTVTTTVSNIGDTAGTYMAALSVDGQEVNTKAISVDPGSSQQVSFQLPQTTVGSYNLAIGNSSATVTVYEWQPYQIQYYHDYDPDKWVYMCIYVSGENGHIVRFTPPTKPFRIRQIDIGAWVVAMFSKDFDENYCTVRIWDKDANNQLWSQDIPWRIFGRTIEVPDIRVDDDFLVEVVTHSTPSVCIPHTETPKLGGDPIGEPQQDSKALRITPMRVVCISGEYPMKYLTSPGLKRPETSSGYSYMGEPIGDIVPGKYKGINWVIQVRGEGAAGN